MGRDQTRAFIIFAPDWMVEEDELVGGAALYRQFKRWLDQHNGDRVGEKLRLE